jgi:hypothetical protein
MTRVLICYAYDQNPALPNDASGSAPIRSLSAHQFNPTHLPQQGASPTNSMPLPFVSVARTEKEVDVSTISRPSLVASVARTDSKMGLPLAAPSVTEMV